MNPDNGDIIDTVFVPGYPQISINRYRRAMASVVERRIVYPCRATPARNSVNSTFQTAFGTGQKSHPLEIGPNFTSFAGINFTKSLTF